MTTEEVKPPMTLEELNTATYWWNVECPHNVYDAVTGKTLAHNCLEHDLPSLEECGLSLSDSESLQPSWIPKGTTDGFWFDASHPRRREYMVTEPTPDVVITHNGPLSPEEFRLVNERMERQFGTKESP